MMKRLFHSLSRTDDGAFVVDARHRIVFWNQAAEALLGYSAEEIVGRQCHEILGGLDEQGHFHCQRFCHLFVQVRRGDSLANRDVFVQTRSGERRWMNMSAFAFADAEKSADQAIVHLFRDVTDQKNYQRFAESILRASKQLRNGAGHHRVAVAQFRAAKDGLTTRERQVLALMAQGLGTGEMAGSMIISPATVRNHVQNVLAKFGVHSRAEAIAYAYQRGLLRNNDL